MSAVGGFFSGLKSGIETGQQVRRNRAVERVIDRENDEYDLGRKAQLEDWIKEGQDPAEFPEFEEGQDPFLIRGFNWLKNKFSSNVNVEPEQGQAVPRQAVPTGSVSHFADGGEVDKDDYRLMQVGPLKMRAPDFDDSREALDRGANAINSAKAGYAEAENPRQKGAAIRDIAGTSVMAAGDAAAGFAKDVLVDNPITQGVLGFIGYDGTRSARQADPSTPPTPAQPAPQVEAPAKQAIDTSVGPQSDSAQVADNAIKAGVQATPGHPDHPDQTFDWGEVADAGGTPDEIPHVGVKDWTEYRRRAVRAAALRGESTEAAHEAVTKMQMQGAQSNLMQAGFLLRAGNAKGAALAARAAFQYFPNGSDVRFGIHQGPNGPVLIGMGTDEETGEPIKEGKPMILNTELMSAMASNFSDPKAFTAWTKDWRDEEFERRQYEEVDKPTAQSEADYRANMGQAALTRSEADLIDASTGGGSGASVRPSDYSRSNEDMAERLYEVGIEDEEMYSYASRLTQIIRRYNPHPGQISDAEIVDRVVEAVQADDMSLLSDLLPATQ